MIRINRLVPADHATVLAKCEFFQPLNSVKDRIGVAMIEAAERDGQIDPRHAHHRADQRQHGYRAGIRLRRQRLQADADHARIDVDRTAGTAACHGRQAGTDPGGRRHAGRDSPRHGTGRARWTTLGCPSSSRTRPTRPSTKRRRVRRSGKTAATTSTRSWPASARAARSRAWPATSRRRIRNFKAIAVEPKNSPVISGGKPGKHRIQGIGAGFHPQEPRQSLLDEVITVDDEDAFEWGRSWRSRKASWPASAAGPTCGPPRKSPPGPEFRGKRIVTIMCSLGERYLSTPLFGGLG